MICPAWHSRLQPGGQVRRIEHARDAVSGPFRNCRCVHRDGMMELTKIGQQESGCQAMTLFSIWQF